MNRESTNMGLVPYHFDPEYSVKDIDSRQHLITDTTAHPSAFSVRLQCFQIVYYCFCCFPEICVNNFVVP